MHNKRPMADTAMPSSDLSTDNTPIRLISLVLIPEDSCVEKKVASAREQKRNRQTETQTQRERERGWGEDQV